jgi:HlyD family secretion protein
MKKFFKILFFILLGVGVVWTFVYLYKKSRPQETEYEIEVAKIDTIQKTTVVTGQIDPRDEVAMKPQVSGIISEILKEPGQQVQQGEVIAVVKVIPDVSNLAAAESQVRVAKMNLDNVEKTFLRQENLKAKGLISIEEFEKSQLDYQQAKESYSNAQDQLNIIKEGISKSATGYSNTKIKATISGMILDIPVKVGNSVINSNTFNDGTTIATIANMKDMVFKGKLDETEVGKIHEGMPMTLTIGAMNDRKFDAMLEYIAPKGTQESGAVFFEMRARTILPDDAFVRAGYSANAEIVLDKETGVVTVPESCISYEAGETYVYRCTKEDKPQQFERQNVQVGLSDGVSIVVKEGLQAGDKIRGNEKTEQP